MWRRLPALCLVALLVMSCSTAVDDPPGTPLEPRNVDRAWHEAPSRAGLAWLRLHDRRHACATFLRLTGASLRTVMETRGHSQTALTMNTYAHVLPQVGRDAIDQAARALFGES